MADTHPIVAAIWPSRTTEVCPNEGERQGGQETPVITWAGQREIMGTLAETFGACLRGSIGRRRTCAACVAAACTGITAKQQ